MGNTGGFVGGGAQEVEGARTEGQIFRKVLAAHVGGEGGLDEIFTHHLFGVIYRVWFTHPYIFLSIFVSIFFLDLKFKAPKLY